MDPAQILSKANPYVIPKAIKEARFNKVDFTDLQVGVYHIYVAYRSGDGKWKVIQEPAGVVKVKEYLYFSLALAEGAGVVEVKQGEKPMLSAKITNAGNIDYSNKLMLYLTPKSEATPTTDNVKMVVEGDVRILPTETAQVKLYPNLDGVALGEYKMYLGYYNKDGQMSFLTASSASSTPECIGTLSVVKKEEAPAPEPKVKPVHATKAYFYQDNTYLGGEFAKIKSKKGKASFTTRVYLKAPNGYRGVIRVALADYQNAQRMIKDKVVEKVVNIADNEENGFVTATFSTAGLYYNYYRVVVHYKGADGRWLVLPSHSVAFYVDFSGYSEGLAYSSDKPTKGDTYVFNYTDWTLGNEATFEGSDLEMQNASVGTLAQSERFVVYPTETIDQITLTVSEDVEAKIYNLTGACVKTLRLNAGDNVYSVRSLPAGVYVVKAGESVRRFIRR